MAKRLNKNLVGALTALVFIVITAAGVFMATALRKVDPEQYAKKAQSFEQEGDYEKAVLYYGRAYHFSEPKAPGYLVAVGNMHELNGNGLKALQRWNEAVTVDPSLVEAHEKILGIYLPNRFWLRAKQTAETILKLEEKNPKALHGLGVAMMRLVGQPEGDREKGLDYLREAQEVAPEVYEYAESLVLDYWRDALTQIVRSQDEEQARRQAGEALQLAKGLVDDNQTAGKGASNSRLLYAELLASSFPDRIEQALSGVLGDHLGGKDRYAQAERMFQEAVEMAGEDAELKSNALAALARHWYQQRNRETDPAAKEKYLQKAKELTHQAIGVWPTGFSSYMLLAQMYANEREYEKAAQVCEGRTKLKITRKGLKAAAQKRLFRQLLHFAAEQCIAAASSRDLEQGSPERRAFTEKAEDFVKFAQVEVPDPENDGKSLYIWGKIKLAQGKDYEALAKFEAADKADGTPRWQNKRWLGVLRFRNGQKGGAREALREATRNPRADAQTWLELARVHMSYQDYELANMAADEALKRSPNLPQALRLKVQANQRLGQSVDELMARLGTEGQTQSVFHARVLYRQGKYAESFEMLKALLEVEPASESALTLLVGVARQLDRDQEAVAMVDKAVVADPQNFNLRALQIRLKPDLTLEQRRELGLKLIQETPDEYLRAHRLADFYRTSEQPNKALEQYRKTVGLLLVDDSQKTPEAKLAGSKALTSALDQQLVLAIELKLWDEVDAVVKTAIEHNVDGAHGMTFKGRSCLVREQYDAATDAFKLAAAEQPSQSKTWAWLGECHYLCDRKTEALAAFTRAVEMNPGTFSAQRRLAQLAKATGEMGEFNMRLDRCLKLNPKDPWIQREELARQEEKNPQEGIARREAFLESNPDDLANLIQLAHLCHLNGDIEKAKQYYNLALENPNSPTGVAWRAAQFLASVGERENAFKVLSDAEQRAEANKDKAAFLLMSGMLYRQHGERGKAEEQFRKAVDLDPGESTFIGLGEHYVAIQKYTDALEWYDKAIVAADQTDSPRASTIRRARFDTLLRMGDRQAAAAAVDEYRKHYPNDPAGDLLDSELQILLGQVDEAVAALTRYIQANPGASSALYRRAQHNASQQKWQEAIRDLENLRAINPDALNYIPRMLLAEAYDRTDRSDLALSELKMLHEEHPEHQFISRRFFQYFMKHERFADAEKVATALVNNDPNNPIWHLCLGQATAQLHDWVKALAGFRDAASMSNYAMNYCRALFDGFSMSENYEAGIRFYEETLPEDKRWPRVAIRYATLLAKVGRVDDAVNAFREALSQQAAQRSEMFVVEVAGNATRSLGGEQAIKLFRNEPADEKLKRPNQHILAALLSSLDHHAEAQAMLDTLISTSSDDGEKASLYGRKGVLAERMQDYQLARRHYEESIKINPDNFIILNNLAYILVDKLHMPAEAVAYAEKAVQLSRDPAVADTLAWALIELGDYGRAIGLLSAAIIRDLEFIAGVVHLGEAYRRNGDFDDAVPLFEQALKLMEQTGNNEYRELAESSLQKARDKISTP
ncbi:MAG: tetratricopeptide repeat protein [Phycisphaerae bacterium]|nr:tetratricopeptide repeat protein [Phycisphaerae bacterium]